MKLNHLIFSSVLLWCTTLKAQNSSYENPTTNIKFAYMGVKSPGFKIGIERPFRIKQINKTKRWGTKTILKEHSLSANFGYYHHKEYHNNLFILGEWQYRRVQPKGMFYEFASGVGYSRTFIDGISYKTDNQGNVKARRFAGNNYGMFSLATGIGYDFEKKNILPAKLYLKSSIYIFAPYNSFFYVRPTIEVGFSYKLKSFFKPNPKLVAKSK
jgi:hypothetical protein